MIVVLLYAFAYLSRITNDFSKLQREMQEQEMLLRTQWFMRSFRHYLLRDLISVRSKLRTTQTTTTITSRYTNYYVECIFMSLLLLCPFMYAFKVKIYRIFDIFQVQELYFGTKIDLVSILYSKTFYRFCADGSRDWTLQNNTNKLESFF